MLKVLAAFLFAPLCVAAQEPRAPAGVDVAALVSEARKNGEAMSRRVFEYSWTTQTRVRRLNKRGRVVQESWQGHEAYPLPGRSFVVQKLVSENGRPLAPARAAKEQRRVNAELAQAELAAAVFADSLSTTQEITGCPAFGVWTALSEPGGKTASFGVSDFLCFAEFAAPRVEQRGGRDVVVLAFRPREGFAPPSPEKAAFAKLVGLLWIDAADKVVSRVEAWLAEDPRAADPRALAPSDAALVFEDVRLPSGMWARGLRYVNTTRNPAAFNGLNVEWRQEFADYRRYYTEFRQYEIVSPRKSQTPPEPRREP